MSNFTRALRLPALKSLHRLTEESGQNWWKDLLTLWEPSGSAAERDGLRLAVRNNYLNFYSRGQSVARVGFTPACEAYVDTHVKYAFASDEKTQDYARLEGTIIRHPKTEEQLKYNGESTLHEWIKRAAEHTGIEKGFVDELVTDNPSIIDLEMGLPAAGERKTAQRMDCVALEQEGDVIRIVFWDAKMIDDSRLRARSDPEVVDQVKIYREYLSDSGQARSVETAYREVLDQLILEAAGGGSNLKVDPEPRLVIFGGKENQKKGNWLFHEDRLWKSFSIPYLSFEHGPYTLCRPEMKG